MNPFEEFQAYRSIEKNEKVTTSLETLKIDDLEQADTLIKVSYSSVNFKDALGVTGKGRIYKKLPIIGGIDLAGEVVECENDKFEKGDQVIATGCGLGESVDGGYSEYVKVSSSYLLDLPENLTAAEAMTLGTAGFTAALCIYRMETNGQNPTQGPIVVTGASGGVGSLAINMLSQIGYDVIAVSGKKEQKNFLHSLGAKEVSSVEELNLGNRPLAKSQFAGAIDNLGGEVLPALLSNTHLFGNVASVGLAAGPTFKSTVMPHILRGVSLLGISSANTPMEIRKKLWPRLASDLKPSKLNDILSRTISLNEIGNVCNEMLLRQTSGRILVKISK